MSASSSSTEIERTSGVSRRQLWLGLVVPTAAWALHGMLGVVIALLSCHQYRAVEGPPPSVTRPILFGLTFVALAVAIASLLLSLKTLRRITGSKNPLGAQGHSREEFMSMIAVFFSIVFVLGIVLNGVPVFLIADLCEGSH